MASSFHLIVLLVLVSISITSGYARSTRDAVLKKYDHDESNFRASTEQEPSMIDVKDLAKARSLQALVVVNRASRGWSFLKKHNSNKVGSLDVLTFVGIIILAVIVTSAIIAFLYNLYYALQTKNTQSIGQGEVGAKEMGHETDEKAETVTMSPQTGKRSNADANV